MCIENLKNKKLLILAGAGVHCKVVRAAKELGIYTIVTDYLEDSPAKSIADEAWMYSVTDVDKIVQRCKEEKIDGVLNFCIDPAQIPYQQICEKLGVPCIGTKEQFEILTDKRKFKDYCLKHDVDVIPEYSKEDIQKGSVEYPLFIKPTDSRGSRGQAVCYNKEDALKAYYDAEIESKNGGVICEKYMGGKQDTGAAFFVVNGVPHLVKFGDRHLGKEEDNLNKQVMCTKLPSEFSEKYMSNVFQRVKRMIQSLGIKFGPVFLQGFIDGDTIRYYDPGFRMPGGDYDLILKQATGFETVKSLIHFALTGDTKIAFGNPGNSYLLNGGTGLLLTISVKPGKIDRIEGMEEVLHHKYVVYGRQIIPEKSIIPESGDIKQRVAAFGIYLPNKKMIKEVLNDVYKTYKVLDENGNDMIISRYIHID